MSEKVFDIIVVGSGLSGLIFAEEYLKKKIKIDIISPTFKTKEKSKLNYSFDLKTLPPQFKKNFNKIVDYFHFNKLNFDKKNCNLLGSLEFGGLSNYWGLQMDRDINEDLNYFGDKVKKEITNCFVEILKEKSLIGNFSKYKNDLKINNFYENVVKKYKDSKELIIEKSLIAISKNNKKNIKKLNPDLILKNIKKKVIFHNFFLEKISKKNDLIFLHCFRGSEKKIFITKKLVLATGTLVTTKLIMEFLNIKREVSIKHHPRLISMYIARRKILDNTKLTAGLLQVKSRKKNEIFSGDLRPSNKMILNMSFKIYKFLLPLKFILMFFKDYIFFSNNLLGSNFSNLYIKKINKKFMIYSKNKKTLKILKSNQKKIFNFLRKEKIIFPFFKNFFPGIGADYHYYGTIQAGRKNKLSVNKNCQLLKNNSIYIIDGSVFNFKNNLYPYGYVIANSKRIAKLINK